MAAEREIYEETGVKGEFQGILAMREYTDYKWGATDLSIVCVLKPIGDETIDVHDKVEISEAKWIPLSEIISNVPYDPKIHPY